MFLFIECESIEKKHRLVNSIRQLGYKARPTDIGLVFDKALLYNISLFDMPEWLWLEWEWLATESRAIQLDLLFLHPAVKVQTFTEQMFDCDVLRHKSALAIRL